MHILTINLAHLSIDPFDLKMNFWRYPIFKVTPLSTTSIVRPLGHVLSSHKWFEFGRDKNGNELSKTIISREYSTEWKTWQ